jgi:hypothetical protein
VTKCFGKHGFEPSKHHCSHAKVNFECRDQDSNLGYCGHNEPGYMNFIHVWSNVQFTSRIKALQYLWLIGLRRWFKAPFSLEAWVRIPTMQLLFFFIALALKWLHGFGLSHQQWLNGLGV